MERKQMQRLLEENSRVEMSYHGDVAVMGMHVPGECYRLYSTKQKKFIAIYPTLDDALDKLVRMVESQKRYVEGQ
jgi:hypothetical protein